MLYFYFVNRGMENGFNFCKSCDQQWWEPKTVVERKWQYFSHKKFYPPNKKIMVRELLSNIKIKFSVLLCAFYLKHNTKFLTYHNAVLFTKL